MPLPKENKKYTYADYCTWDEGGRWELIDGVPYAMAPAPGFTHQNISGNIFAALHVFLRGKACRVFHAPFDVRLNADDEDDIVVQPDILVVCEKSKLSEKGCKGAPDLVIEIMSPSTARHNRITKLNKYRDAGVREYWLVDSTDHNVQVMVFETGAVQGYTDADTVPVTVLPGCEVNLQDVFSE